VPLQPAEWIVAVCEAYVAAGAAFAALFLPRAITRVDARVAAAPRTLRLLLAPGIVALWPLFAWRWLAGSPEPVERNPHRLRARVQPAAGLVESSR
jgi:hypothetical protein